MADIPSAGVVRARSWDYLSWGWNWRLTHSHICWLWWLWDGWDFSCCYWPEHLFAVLHVAACLPNSMVVNIWECPKGTMWMCIAFSWPLRSHSIIQPHSISKGNYKGHPCLKGGEWALPIDRIFVSLTLWKLHVKWDKFWSPSLGNTIWHKTS